MDEQLQQMALLMRGETSRCKTAEADAQEHQKLAEALKAKTERQKNAVTEAVRKFLIGSRKGLLVSVLQSWSGFTRAEKNKKRARGSITASIEKFLLGENLGLKLASFQGWRDAWKDIQASREAKALEEELIAANAQGTQMKHENDCLHDDLDLAYKQLDRAHKSLHDEIKTKEDLAGELRDVYQMLRQRGDGTSTIVGSSSRRLVSDTSFGTLHSRPAETPNSRVSLEEPPTLPRPDFWASAVDAMKSQGIIHDQEDVSSGTAADEPGMRFRAAPRRRLCTSDSRDKLRADAPSEDFGYWSQLVSDSQSGT
jgi:hypothetical protein